MHKYLIAGGLLFSGTLIILIAAAVEALLDKKKKPVKPVRTVVWRDEHCRYLMNSFTGTVEGFDDWRLWLTNDEGYCCLVDARDIVEVF